MSIFADGFARKQLQTRRYQGAQGGRLFSDWIAAATSADSEIRTDFRRLLDRSRSLERDNDYMKGFLLACERNILGAIQLDLRMDCGEYVLQRGAAPKWVSDPAASAQIEQAWIAWGEKGVCSLDGRHSWAGVKRLAVRSVPRDGNFLVRKVRGPAARNEFNFALQIWEVDHLDLRRFETLRNGNDIKFGIETDADQRVAAYWLMAKHPGEYFGDSSSSTSTRFAADEIYHVSLFERAEQSIGVPWVSSAITRLRQLGMFEEAAVVAARIGASKQGFFKKTPGPNGEMGSWTGETTADGRGVMDAQPGTFEELPAGWDLADWSPDYPNTTTGDFRKAMLRGVCTGLGTTYTTLGNDLEAVNLSSARVGLFEEREGWKALQVFFKDDFYRPVFKDFLEAAIMSGAVNLPLGKFAKFNRPLFKARRWPYMDPAKEIAAQSNAVALRITSRRQIIEENGGDVDDVFQDNVDDEKLATDKGLDLAPATITSTSGAIGASADALAQEGDGETSTSAATNQNKGAKVQKAAAIPAKPAPTAQEIVREAMAQLQEDMHITVNIPAINVAPPEVRNEIHVPAQPAPIVNVTMPEYQRAEPPVIRVEVPQLAPPVIRVEVPQQAAPIVKVNVPKSEGRMTIERDADGNILSAEIK